MDSKAPSNREAEEHIKLLRRASRTRLVLLGLWAVVTWGLWTALQACDQKAAPIDDTYAKRLAEARKKWDVPEKAIIVYTMDCSEIIMELDQLKLPTDNSKIANFCKELESLRNEYYPALEAAYTVHAKMPYLQEPVEINGITLAYWWPFGLIAIVASAIVLNMRERINAVIVAWISYSRKNSSDEQDLIVHSDFLVGTLAVEGTADRQCMVYRKPLMIQPESLLVYILVGATIYLSFSFGLFQNPANSYEMESILLDYVALIWFFLAVLTSLVWLTRKRYAESLEQYIGMPVRGRISRGLELALGKVKRRVRHALAHRKWMPKIAPISEGLFAIAALLCLCLPWMNPGRVRGYQFFLSTVPNPLNDDLYSELQPQLFFAILFLILCLIDWFLRTVSSRPKFGFLSKVRRFFGLVTVALLGNLVFHFAMLQVLVAGQAERTWLILPWNPLARPHPLKNSPLVWADPSYGFWLFLLLCLMLLIVGRKTTVKHFGHENHARKLEPQPEAGGG